MPRLVIQMSGISGVVFALVMLAGCSSLRVEPAGVHHGYDDLASCTLNDRGLSKITLAVLEQASTSPRKWRRESRDSLAALERYALEHAQDGAVQQALIEQTIAVAQKLTEASPEQALQFYLRAAERAAPLVKAYSPEQWPFLFHLNQFATARAVELLAHLEWPDHIPALPSEKSPYAIDLATTDAGGQVNPYHFDSLTATDRVDLNAFDRHVRQSGLGAPFVARCNAPIDPEAKRYFPKGGLFRPISAVLGFEGRAVTLTFYDVLERSSLLVGDREVPLAADFSVAWGRQVDSDPNSNGLLGMLRPGKVSAHMALTFTEPFRADAIPVVFVHGLASNGATWDETINGLLADERIRQRYQFWLYQYPSGISFLYPASDLRHAIREVRSHFDPQHRLPALDQIVLVGHSMGGLISSAQIRRTDEKTWEEFFKRPLDQLVWDEASRDRLREFLYLSPDGNIKRVIFVATPHRGSSIADSWIGRLVSRLIELPSDIISLNVTGILQEVTDTGVSLIDVATNSVTRLRHADPTLQMLVGLAVDEDVVIHSIVGDRGLGNAPESSDGVVSYESSHLSMAASEKIVPAWHRVHRHPEAIEEIRRILLLHLESLGTLSQSGYGLK